MSDAQPSGNCVNKCGRPAVAEKFVGFIGEDEIVELVCYECAVDDTK
jgi:hypothetical protein